jgi:hypothetical protein
LLFFRRWRCCVTEFRTRIVAERVGKTSSSVAQLEKEEHKIAAKTNRFTAQNGPSNAAIPEIRQPKVCLTEASRDAVQSASPLAETILLDLIIQI